MDGITPASITGVLDKDEVKHKGFDFDEHSVEGIDYENKDVNKEDFCCRGNTDTNTNINSKVQSAKKVDEGHVEVEMFVQGDLAEEIRKDERKAKSVKFDAVNNEQTILSAAERLLTDQGNCANSMKKSAEINDDRNINKELNTHRDYADAPFGTRERPSSPFNKCRKSLIDESPDDLIYISDNGSMEHQEEDVINGCVYYNNSNDDIDLYKCSEGTILNGNGASRFKILRNTVRRLERPLSVFVVTMSVLLFMADIVTDCLLAGEYYTEAKMGLFSATVVLIIGPAVIMSIVDLSWLYIDINERHSSEPRNNEWTNMKWILTLRVLLGVFSFGRIVRSVQYIYHYLMFTNIKKSETGKRGTERQYQKSRAKEERRDFYMLDFINAFTESCLQLMVQLFLFFQYDLNLDVIRASSLCTSWISIAWTLVSYYSYNRDAISSKQAPTILGICICFIARACELAARITAIVLFVTVFHFWGLFLVFHFLGMLLWLVIFSRPKLDDIASTKFGKVLYTILYAFVLNFCFINLEEKRTFKRMLVFYMILYSESFIMAILVLISALEHEGIHSYKVKSLIIVPLGCVIHLMAQTVFYLCCHPTVSEKYQCSKCMSANNAKPDFVFGIMHQRVTETS